MKIKEYKKWDILEITWIDSIDVSGWRQSDYEIDDGHITNKTIGYFLGNTKKCIATVHSLGVDKHDNGTQNIDHIMQIPWLAVLNIKKI